MTHEFDESVAAEVARQLEKERRRRRRDTQGCGCLLILLGLALLMTVAGSPVALVVLVVGLAVFVVGSRL